MMTERECQAGTVVDCQMFRTKTGIEAIDITFELETHERLHWIGFFTNKSRHLTEEALKALGFDWNDLDACRKEVIGRHASCVIEADDFNDTVTRRVQWVNAPGSGGREEMSRDEVRDLQQRLLRKDAASDAPQDDGSIPF